MSARDFDGSAFVAEVLPAFIAEAEEQIERIEQLLLEIEDRPGDRDLLDALFRCAHTVKGSAGIFGLDAVVAFTHHVETLLDRLREGALVPDPALSTLLLRCNDQIRTLVAAAQDPAADPADGPAVRAALVRELQAATGGSPAPAAAAPTAAAPATTTTRSPGERCWQLDVHFGADSFRDGMDPLAIIGFLQGLGRLDAMRVDRAAVPPIDALDAETCHLAFRFELLTAAPRSDIESAFTFVQDTCTLSITEATATATPTPTAGPSGAPAAAAPRAARPRDAHDDTRSIRIPADRLDAVINLLGELVIASAGAELLARQTRNRPLAEANHQIGRLVEEIRNGTLQLRMVPIGETFSRFRRVVRDTAAELGKEVALEIEGGDTELDKSVVEHIADPLMHLVRNGLDHGLEPPAERLAAGKPAQGRLKLSARHDAGNIVIRIDDDGRGIRRRKVLERAWARGLVPEGTVPPDDEICRLILEPGFSTAEQVTNLSGRGVGMDVVKKNIEALRGSVRIDSVEGQGSGIEIRLPLTLAIIDGFLVGVGSSRFIFPLDAVVEVIEGRAAAGHTDARGRACVELRGHALPVADLRTLYALEGERPPRSSIVVLRGTDSRPFGVRVDQLQGQHQTVIKPLSRLFRGLRGLAGSTILGNGEVALIFDVPALGRLAAEPPKQTPAEGPSA